jgi:hypothetical protein
MTEAELDALFSRAKASLPPESRRGRSLRHQCQSRNQRPAVPEPEPTVEEPAEPEEPKVEVGTSSQGGIRGEKINRKLKPHSRYTRRTRLAGDRLPGEGRRSLVGAKVAPLRAADGRGAGPADKLRTSLEVRKATQPVRGAQAVKLRLTRWTLYPVANKRRGGRALLHGTGSSSLQSVRSAIR